MGHWVWWSSAWVTVFGGDWRASIAFSSRKSRNLTVEFISSAAPYHQRFAPPEIVIVHRKSRRTSHRYHCIVKIPQRKKPRLSLLVLDSAMHRFVIVHHYVFVQAHWVWWRSVWVWCCWVSVVTLGFILFSYILFFLCVFVPVGFWWAVVAWWAWWRHGGGDWAVEAR